MFAGLINGGVAIVTGAAGGLGCACVFALAEGGASTVVLADLNKDALEGVALESKRFATDAHYQTLCLKVDLLNEADLHSMVDAAIKQFGRIDYFVQAAGIDSRDYEDITSVTVSDYDLCLNGNVKGNLLAMKAVASVMKTQDARTIKGRHGTIREGFRGSIVIVASANAYAPLPNKVAYVTAKHAVLGMVKSAALDLAAQHVRVNAICPTWTNTPMFQAEQEKIPEIGNMVKAIVPIGRAAETEEVADVIAFLCSEHASYVTGTGLVVDSGATLTVKMG